MKIFAFYLPQFHAIPENDMWWGDGFTEWTNVKKAKPLFEGHVQPLHPLENNYYNLLEKKTVEWQTKLLHEYGLTGMIYYHYYFRGKKLLEKPAENLLKWKDIDQPFFFCWANHSWKRTWNGSSELLIEQTYGKEKDWERHFQYLLQFFKDERYEKKDNRPLFMLFDINFAEKNSIIKYFDKRCKENGFSGIYVINTISDVNDVDVDKSTEYWFARQPNCAMKEYHSLTQNKHYDFKFRLKRKIDKITHKCNILTFDGNRLFRIMTENKRKYSNCIPGLCFSWDNSPRHGERGYIITPPNQSEFNKYMDSVHESEYLFVNAWNEWCEGMILEPTEENGFKYLEWIKEWENNA